jgi:hypothetical protein
MLRGAFGDRVLKYCMAMKMIREGIVSVGVVVVVVVVVVGRIVS